MRRVELMISGLLRTGVLASMAVALIGLGLSFTRHGDYLKSPATIEKLVGADAVYPHTPADVFKGVAQPRGPALVMLGVFLLIATPVARVAVSILAFVYQRDWIFVIVTTAVLALLIASFLLGEAGF